MASWTDKTPTFNPYIQQLPVEAMVEVGVQKQKQYEEGVQKIQTSIDNIAGLDVVRDVDKAYLQSKINKLGNDLRYVAAGDFSNFQLVNSVSGMTTQIIGDPNVQNAVGSAAKYRKEVALMEEEKKKGTLTPDNKYVFDKQAGEWLNDSTIGKSFNASYTPYFDVFKFTKETFDAVKPDGYSYDQIFETDAAGNPRVDAKGNPILSTTMVRLEKEGIFPDKVKATLDQVFSDPRVGQQLNISGQYNYRGLDSKALEEKVSLQREDTMAAYANKLMDLNLKKSMGEKVDDQISELQSQINNTSSSYDELSQLAYDNPDGVKGMLYKDDVSSKYTTMFGWNKTKQQTLDNPAWKAEFDMQKEANEQKRWASEQSYKRERDQIDDAKWQLKFDQDERLANLKGKPKAGTAGGGAGGAGDGGDATFESAEKNRNEIQFHDTQMQMASNDYANASDSFMWETMFSKIPSNVTKYNKLVDEGMDPDKAISLMINNAAKKSGQDPEAYKTTWLNRATQEYQKSTNAKPSVKDSYIAYKNSKKSYDAVLAIDNNVKKRTRESLGEVANELVNMDLKPETIKWKDKTYNLSKEDMFDLAIATQSPTAREALSGSTEAKLMGSEANAAVARLQKRGKGELINAYKTYNSDTQNRLGMLSENDQLWGNLFSGNEPTLFGGVKKVSETIAKKQYKEGLSKKADIIRSAYGKSPNRSYTVATGDTDTDKLTLANIKRMAGGFKAADQNLSGDFNDFYSSITSKDVKNMEDLTLEYRVTTNERGEPAVEIISYTPDGRAGGMTVTTDQAKTLQLDLNSIYEPQDVITVRNVINNNPLRSTSKGDPLEKSTYINGDSWFDNDDLPNMQNSRFEVQSNIKYINGKYYSYLYAKDPSTNKSIIKELDGDTNLQNVIMSLKTTINPTSVQLALLQNNAR